MLYLDITLLLLVCRVPTQALHMASMHGDVGNSSENRMLRATLMF